MYGAQNVCRRPWILYISIHTLIFPSHQNHNLFFLLFNLDGNVLYILKDILWKWLIAAWGWVHICLLRGEKSCNN